MNSNYIYKKTEKNFERKDELNRIVTLLNKNYQSFQEKYNIAKSGDPGYGYVGPKTRAKINSL